MAVFIADPGGIVPPPAPESTPVESDLVADEPGTAIRATERVEAGPVRHSAE